jgi:hypothetical protein
MKYVVNKWIMLTRHIDAFENFATKSSMDLKIKIVFSGDQAMSRRS